MSEHDGTDGAAHEDCIIVPTDDGETEWNPFDEFHGEVDMPAVPKVMAKDGMPTNFAPFNDDSDIPPLSPASCVCMGIYDSFVVRDDWGDVLATFNPGEVERSPNGGWRVNRKLCDKRLGKKARSWWLLQLSRNLASVLDEWVRVDPLRPPCKHYVRQLAPYYLNPKHKKAFRLCAARRTTEGTFMDISDMGMFACDMREPRHSPSQDLIDQFDQKKMQEGANRKYLPMFQGFDRDKDKQGPGGIFSG